jgi:hypothetical protein
MVVGGQSKDGDKNSKTEVLSEDKLELGSKRANLLSFSSSREQLAQKGEMLEQRSLIFSLLSFPLSPCFILLTENFMKFFFFPFFSWMRNLLRKKLRNTIKITTFMGPTSYIS